VSLDLLSLGLQFQDRCLGGLSNPSPGVLDFDGYRSLQPLFDAAKAAGLWIVFRPGVSLVQISTAN
jgi:beta-galactosidase GanA